MDVFDWDEANVGHLAAHRVLPEEAEEVLIGDAIQTGREIRDGEIRFKELGETARGRILEVAWTERNGRLRVVTGYDADRKKKAYWISSQGEI